MIYSNIYLEAKEHITNSLNEGGIVLSNYGETHGQRCLVDTFFIEEEEYETKYANLTLVITYKVPHPTDIIEKHKKLRVLANTGDYGWTTRLRALVWDGKYPDTVALDVDNGELYLVRVKEDGLHLTYFNDIEEIEVEYLLEDIEDREPYKIQIDENAMYEVLDGSEGYRHLFRNVQVVLHGNIKYVIKSRLVV